MVFVGGKTDDPFQTSTWWPVALFDMSWWTSRTMIKIMKLTSLNLFLNVVCEYISHHNSYTKDNLLVSNEAELWNLPTVGTVGGPFHRHLINTLNLSWVPLWKIWQVSQQHVEIFTEPRGSLSKLMHDKFLVWYVLSWRFLPRLSLKWVCKIISFPGIHLLWHPNL